MDVLPGVWSLSPLAALVGSIVLVGWLIYTGRLIPKTSHERELAQQKERADDWKATAKDYEATNTEIRAQNRLLIQSNEITAYFFKAVSPHIGDTLEGPKGRS